MTNFYEKTSGVVQRAHKTLAHDVTVVNYEWDADAQTNEYADGAWVESSRETVSGTLRDASLDDVRNGPEGQELSADTVIFVAADVSPVRTGTDDESRATEFIDGRTNKTYEAVNVKNEGSLLRVLTYEV